MIGNLHEALGRVALVTRKNRSAEELRSCHVGNRR